MDASAFWTRVVRGPECWDWEGPQYRNGYGQVWLNGTHTTAHRAAYAITFGPIPAGMYVLHSCDRPICVRPDHLRLGTPRENSRDMAAKGRTFSHLHPEVYPRGARHPRSKLTAEQVADIRARLGAGETQEAIARDFGVVRQTISWIKSGQTWGSYEEMNSRHR